MLEAISPVLDGLRTGLGPYYFQLKFLHLLSVIIWAGSTAVAYGWYVRQTYLAWQADPENLEKRKRRDWMLEQFDRGAIMEHVAFPIVLVTGIVLFLAGGWKVGARPSWLLVKLIFVVAVFVPMEIVDCWLCHFGGNKYRLRRSGDLERHERVVAAHWVFLRVTTPLVIVTVPLVVYLAVVKPF